MDQLIVGHMPTDGHIRISLLLNWYSEVSFLDEMWDSVRDLVDEVVVVAGPYAFAVDALDAMGLCLDAAEAEGKIRSVLGDVDLAFVHSVWPTEYEKRVAGYEACTGDLILIVDADEVVRLERSRLEALLASQYAVARMDVINVAFSTAVFGSEYYDYVDRFPTKNVLFDATRISARDHINYLWLVGVDQDSGSLLAAMPESLGTMLHMTGPRSPRDHLTRMIFYKSLWFHTNAPERAADLLDQLAFFTDFPQAFLASSLDGLGVSVQTMYRPIPERAIDCGDLWLRLQARAAEFEVARGANADLAQWPAWGEYFLLARPVQGNPRTWSLDVAPRFRVLDFMGVLPDGTVGAFSPESVRLSGSRVEFTTAEQFELLPPIVRTSNS